MDALRQLDRDSWESAAKARSHIVVSSRRRVLDQLLSATVADVPRPVLLTGEPGAGKTWLTHRLGENLEADWRIAHVDVSASMDALDFLTLLGNSLAVSVPDRLGAARLSLHSALEDEAQEGRRWLLVVDEAHRGTAPIWDEIQAIRNRLMDPSGFAALIVVGRTELARSLRDHRINRFEISLQSRAHLMPLDLDEARELLSAGSADGIMDEEVLETLHRDARGNPSRLLILADDGARQRPDPVDATLDLRLGSSPGTGSISSTRSIAADRAMAAYPSVGPASSRGELGGFDRNHASSLIPAKPPIRVEEGLVEVGWEGDLDTEPDVVAPTTTGSAAWGIAETTLNEELVDDRHAALEAWVDWTREHGRVSVDGDSESGGLSNPVGTLEIRPTVAEGASVSTSNAGDESDAPDKANVAASNVRAEPQHDHAPYSQLFTRLRQSR